MSKLLKIPDEALAYIARLESSSQSLIDHWHTPKWKDGFYTFDYIHKVTQALASKPESLK